MSKRDPGGEKGLGKTLTSIARPNIKEAMAIEAFLEVTTPEGQLFWVELGVGEILLGRSSECRVQLPCSNVSRVHAKVFELNDEYCVQDLNSTNGTFVNGVRVARCVLRANDVIEIGNVRLVFVEGGAGRT